MEKASFLRPAFNVTIFIAIRGAFHTAFLQVLYHFIKFSTPKLFEPFCFTKPFNKRRADGIRTLGHLGTYIICQPSRKRKSKAMPCF